MPKRSRKPPERDYQEIAHDVFAKVLQKAEGTPPAPPESPAPASKTEDELRREYAQLLGSRGGKKGGPARAAKLTKEQRSASARKAAKARWKRPKSEQ